MNNNLIVKGTQDFLGKEIPVIEGGFGEGKRCILVREISQIHNMKIGNVNQRINDNRRRFKDGIDIIDLNTSDVFKDFIQENNLLTSNRTKNIYLLSERGYAKLIKIMDTDLAWEIHDKLIDEYFTMREIINSDEQLKANLLLSIYNGGQEGILASKQLTEIEVQEARKPLLETIDEKEAIIDRTINDEGLFEIGVVGKMLKPYCSEFGAKKIFTFLHNKGVLKNRPNSQVHNNPYDKFAKYFEMRNVEVETTWGSRTYCKTYFNGKGLKWFLNKLAKEGYITKAQIKEIEF